MTTGDQRDVLNWVVLELTRLGETRANEGTLGPVLLEALEAKPDHPVFIPSMAYVKDGNRVTIHLMEGYAFVASGLAETYYLNLERDCPYVKKVLAIPGPQGMPVLSVIGNADVADMRERLQDIIAQDIDVGMRVVINQGTYAKLIGDVVGFEGDDAHVHIKLRSFEVIRTIPRMFLSPAGEDDAQ